LKKEKIRRTQEQHGYYLDECVGTADGESDFLNSRRSLEHAKVCTSQSISPKKKRFDFF
jgi:hypothetical protein